MYLLCRCCRRCCGFICVSGKIEQEERLSRLGLPSELGVLQSHVDNIKVQLDQAVVDRSAVPVFGDAFVSFVVREFAFFSLDCKEALDHILG
jgi:hypothetical protein